MKNRGTVRIGKNTLALFVMQVGTRGLTLWLMAQLSRTVGVEGLGRYILAMTAQGVALAVAEWGLNVYAIRELAHQPASEDAAAFMGTLLGLKLALSLAMVCLLNLLIAPFFFPDRAALIALASWSLAPEALSNGIFALIRAKQRMEISSAVTLGVRTVATLGGVILLSRGYDERAALVAYNAGSILGLLALGWLLRAWKLLPRFGALRQTGWGHLRAATPFALTGIVAMLYRRMDVLMLSYWAGDATAGVYGAAYRVWETLGIVPASLLDALFPEMARRERQMGRAALRTLYRRGLWVMVGLLAALLLPALILAPWGMRVLYGDLDTLQTVVRVFRWLMVALPFTYLYLLNGHTLYATGHQKQVTVWMTVVTLANGVLNALLIPRWQIAGAVGVALFSEVALFVTLTVTARRQMVHLRSGTVEQNGQSL